MNLNEHAWKKGLGRALASGAMAMVCAWAAAALASSAVTWRSGEVQDAKAGDAKTQQEPAAAGPVVTATLKAKTRLITVDVVATDSHGNAITDLKAEDFEISEPHNVREKIVEFRLVTRPASATGRVAGRTLPANVYSNVLVPGAYKVPPTILLVDALNTATATQPDVRRNLLLLLKKVPDDTPVAVFGLTGRLKMLQTFTSDPGLLKAAIDKSVSATILTEDPVTDQDSMTNFVQDSPVQMPADAMQSIEAFERENYAFTMDARVRGTVEALKSLAQYLAGYPGRKNLVWISASFPISIDPDPDLGTRQDAGMRQYTEQIQDAANQLTGAEVSVYTVDARGLETSKIFSATQRSTGMSNPARMNKQMRTESTNRIASQATLQEIADDTGGRPCVNTNDLAACVENAMKDGSSYYEMAYYPEGVAWDGRFHKITVKATRGGVKLRYRRGYYATDTPLLAKTKTADNVLQDACRDPLPTSTIGMMARGEAPDKPDEVKYLVRIAPTTMKPAADNTAELKLRLAVCTYDANGTQFHYFPRDVAQPIPGNLFQKWKVEGVPAPISVAVQPGMQRIRLAVLDVNTGLAGTIDVPATPVTAPALATGVPAAAAAHGEERAWPDTVGIGVSPGIVPTITHKLIFQAGSKMSTLDWSGDAIVYKGDLDVAESAQGLFTKVGGGKYHCDAGRFVPIDPAAKDDLSRRLTFKGENGRSVAVDFGGTQPAYEGEMKVDASAEAFFQAVWRLYHCPGA